MNVRLKRKFHFSAAVYADKEFHVNNYELDMDFTIISEEIGNHNVALNRIKHWIFNVLEDSCLIAGNDLDSVKKLQALGIRTVTLPEEPWDQIIGIMLYTKLQAITEPHFEITEIGLSSHSGDRIQYLHNEQESQGPFDSDSAWWHRPDPSYTDRVTKNAGKVVSLAKVESWQSLDLSWTDEEEDDDETVVFTPDDASTVVFGKFKPDED